MGTRGAERQAAKQREYNRLYWDTDKPKAEIVKAVGCPANTSHDAIGLKCKKCGAVHRVASRLAREALGTKCRKCRETFIEVGAPPYKPKASKSSKARRAASYSPEKSEWKVKYILYLQSPEWKARRDAVVERDKRRCRVCNSPQDLNVHHRTYERVGAEADEDLITLCAPCHDLFHKHRWLTREWPTARQ